VCTCGKQARQTVVCVCVCRVAHAQCCACFARNERLAQPCLAHPTHAPTCVSASVLLISRLKISLAAIIANGVSSPSALAMPIAIAVLPAEEAGMRVVLCVLCVRGRACVRQVCGGGGGGFFFWGGGGFL
jgi:hypothetical protein